MPKKKTKAKTKIKAKTRRKPRVKKKPALKRGKGLRQSKTENFLEYIRKNNSMVDYIMNLRIMNPAAEVKKDLNEPRREGGFVRLAHAREEFTAPKLNKGKYFLSQQKKAKAKKRKK